MSAAFPDAYAADYQALIPQMTCHKNDRHVLAAAMRCAAASLVTFSIWHFPPASLDRYSLRAVHPDQFLLDQLDLFETKVVEVAVAVPATERLR